MEIFVRKLLVVGLLAIGCLTGCVTNRPGEPLARKGDEIMVAGQLFHTGTRVVLWTDPGGYDAYRTERRFSPMDKSSYEATSKEVKDINSPNRYGMRRSVLTDEEAQLVRGGGWPLSLLQQKVDQFVIHYDVAGTSKMCFLVLHDMRDLSVQFMCDIDGTIYQTLDLKERAWHATRSNSRSVGVEVANMGAYRPSESISVLKEWYAKDAQNHPIITIPKRFIDRLGEPITYTKNFQGRPARPNLIEGEINGQMYRQYDFTPEQYAALTRLTATLCTVLPKITCDVPRDAKGHVINHVLPDAQFEKYQGVMGHWHVQKEKQDPGPAFDFDKLITGARDLMSVHAGVVNREERGHPVTTPATITMAQQNMEKPVAKKTMGK